MRNPLGRRLEIQGAIRRWRRSVHQFICLTDNYGVLLHDFATGATASIDAPEAAPILAAAKERGWRLTDVLLTHHHADHIQGVPRLKESFPELRVCGPAKEASRIPFLDVLVGEGDYASVGSLRAKVIETPGHTLGHVAYHFDEEEIAFCGDTIFSLGCGRAFEAPYEVLWNSLMKLAALPGETRLYCGHEYTEANARFAITIEAQNPVLRVRVEEVAKLRAGEAAHIADNRCGGARGESILARGRAFGSGGGRHAGRGSGRGVCGTPLAQGPFLTSRSCRSRVSPSWPGIQASPASPRAWCAIRRCPRKRPPSWGFPRPPPPRRKKGRKPPAPG